MRNRITAKRTITSWPSWKKNINLTKYSVSQKQKMLDAAKFALAIVNKMPPSEFKRKHTSRIFSNMNKIRSKNFKGFVS